MSSLLRSISSWSIWPSTREGPANGEFRAGRWTHRARIWRVGENNVEIESREPDTMGVRLTQARAQRQEDLRQASARFGNIFNTSEDDRESNSPRRDNNRRRGDDRAPPVEREHRQQRRSNRDESNGHRRPHNDRHRDAFTYHRPQVDDGGALGYSNRPAVNTMLPIVPGFPSQPRNDPPQRHRARQHRRRSRDGTLGPHQGRDRARRSPELVDDGYIDDESVVESEELPDIPRDRFFSTANRHYEQAEREDSTDDDTDDEDDDDDDDETDRLEHRRGPGSRQTEYRGGTESDDDEEDVAEFDVSSLESSVSSPSPYSSGPRAPANSSLQNLFGSQHPSAHTNSYAGHSPIPTFQHPLRGRQWVQLRPDGRGAWRLTGYSAR